MIGDPRQMSRNKKWQSNFYTMVTAKTATETKSKSHLGMIIIKFFMTHGFQTHTHMLHQLKMLQVADNRAVVLTFQHLSVKILSSVLQKDEWVPFQTE